jgi:hypothetical protein
MSEDELARRGHLSGVTWEELAGQQSELIEELLAERERNLEPVPVRIVRDPTPWLVKKVNDPSWPGLIPLAGRAIWGIVSWAFIFFVFALAIGQM